MADFVWKAGDTPDPLTDTLKHADGTTVNLTGATVRFALRQVGAAAPVATTGTASILNAPGGAVAFQPSAQDTATPGLYQASWVVTFGSGNRLSFPAEGNLWGEIQASVTSTTAPPGVEDLIRPSVTELGRLLRARTVVAGTGGNEAGTFNENTRPTGDEADELLDQAVQAVLMSTGANIPSRFIPQTRWLVLLQAAMLVELTFFPNDVARDQSPYGQYKALHDQTMAALRGSIADEDPASTKPAFYSVPVLNQQQAHWQDVFAAINPATGNIDPTKLPPSEFYPMGVGGIPASVLGAWPWLFGDGGLDGGLAFLED